MNTASPVFNPIPLSGYYWSGEKIRYQDGEKPLHDYLFTHARDAPNQTAYIFYGSTFSWAQAENQIRRMARFLQQRGVQKGQRIALYMQNCPHYIFAHYAIQSLGAIVVPCSPQNKTAEIHYLFASADVSAVICGVELYQYLAPLRSALTALNTVVTLCYQHYLPDIPTLPVAKELLTGTDRQPDDTLDWEIAIADCAPLLVLPEIDLWNDIALMPFTSGSTGRPKGAMLSYGSSLYKMAAAHQADPAPRDGVSIASMPMCHIAGMNLAVCSPVYSRRTTVILNRFDPETFVQAVEKYQCDRVFTTAMMNLAILDYPGIQQRNLHSLQDNPCTSFGSKVTQVLADRWLALTGNCLLYEAAYGLTETHTSDTRMPPHRVKWGSCGLPVAETFIQIIDPVTGKDCTSNQPGEIVVSSPAVFKGYWQNSEVTANTLKKGAVYTGDIGYLDEEGYLYFSGRIKEMIKSSGYSVFPEDVEILMQLHPAVAQCAAIGVADETKGEAIILFIILNADHHDISESELIVWAKNNISSYKCPREICFVDKFPTSPTGKVLRRLLTQ